MFDSNAKKGFQSCVIRLESLASAILGADRPRPPGCAFVGTMAETRIRRCRLPDRLAVYWGSACCCSRKTMMATARQRASDPAEINHGSCGFGGIEIAARKGRDHGRDGDQVAQARPAEAAAGAAQKDGAAPQGGHCAATPGLGARCRPSAPRRRGCTAKWPRPAPRAPPAPVPNV